MDDGTHLPGVMNDEGTDKPSGEGEDGKDEVLVARIAGISLAALALMLVFTGVMFGAGQLIPDYRAGQYFHVAVAELKSAPMQAPVVEGSWARDGALVFERGWAVYRMSSSRGDPFKPDLAVLKTMDGRWFISKHAFGATSIRVTPDAPRPGDMDQYLAQFRRHGWEEIQPPE